MKLVVVSHTPHYESRQGVVGWGPTVREIDHLARLFAAVVHLAPLYREASPAAALPYASPRVALRAVAPAGGARWVDKPGILLRAPGYLGALRRELADADAVHVRCPANISLLSILSLASGSRWLPCWVKYAGNWQPRGGRDPWSYRFQRFWLRRGWRRLAVTVNGRWQAQPAHVHSFHNPCLTLEELDESRRLAAGKQLSSPVRLLFVGALNEAKGCGRALEVLARLHEGGLAARLDLIGDGPQRRRFEGLAERLGVAPVTTFHGWLPRSQLAPHYADAHFLLLLSASEGWPKVVSEAMAHGVVPIAGAVSSIPQILGEQGFGRALEPRDVTGAASAVADYLEQPPLWSAESRRGSRFAAHFTYDRYLDAVASLFVESLGLRLEPVNTPRVEHALP